MLRAAMLLSLLALSLTACGADSSNSSPPKQHTCPATKRALAKLDRDLAAIRKAAKLPTKDSLIGNHAINVATDRFLYDVATAPIGNLARNRLIDHAMAALVGTCEQCFQALEAGRPIPAIRAGDLKCSSR